MGEPTRGRRLRALRDRALGPLYDVVSRVVINRLDDALPTAPRSADCAWAALYRDGFVNLGDLGLEVDPLSRRVKELFDAVPASWRAGHATLNTINIRNPMLLGDVPTPFLRHERVNRAVREYLGDDAIVDQVRISRVLAESDSPSTSGQWHHDRVGRRLVLWVLLHDVDALLGRPTLYAVGTHRRKLEKNDFRSTRFSDETVRAMCGGRVAPMAGKKGDAILLDTHGLHRATFEKKAHHRDVMFIEYSGRRKSAILEKLGLPIGAQRGLYPADFDPSGTLLRKELFRHEGRYLRYAGAHDSLEDFPCVDGRDHEGSY
jgi:hypothetical protein